MKFIDNLETGFIDVDGVVIDGIAAVLMKLLELLILGGSCDFLKNVRSFHLVLL